MVVEAVHNYVNMVNGLTKTTRARAKATAKALLAQAGLGDVASDAGERVGKLADEIMAASRANRELLEKLVSAEVDKAAARWGFVRTEDMESLRQEVAELRRSLARATVKASAADTSPDAPAKKATTRRAPAKKTAEKKASPRKTTARKSTTSPAPAGDGAS
ncbi:MAG: polyhydroxyalkanoate synthesis protein PhaF [Propionibacteriaceae bacterium]|nr:polyhydroxyalkanoate synthesis protein PhaF [Propionibacteriaceae bacterium]